MHFGRQLSTKLRYTLCQDRGRCWCGLLSETRSCNGVLASRRRDLRRTGTMPLRSCSRRRAIPVWVVGYQDEVFFTENSVACLLGRSFYGEPQERVRKCISDDNLRRNSVLHGTKIVVDAGVGSFRRHDHLRTRSPAEAHHASPDVSSPACYPGVGRR